MKVLHVFKVYRPSHGGIVHIIEKLARGLAAQAYSRVLVSREKGLGRSETVDGVTVQRTLSLGQLFALPLSPTFPFWFWWRAQKADVIDYHYPYPLVDLAVSIWLPKRATLVIHWHSEIVAQRRLGALLAPLIRRSLARASCVIVASPMHIDNSPFLRNVREKCVVIPFGVDVDWWQTISTESTAEVEKLRARWPRLVVAVGRLVPYKGFDVLLRAMTQVDGTLMLIGDGPLRHDLDQLACELGISERVLLRGSVSDTDLKVALHAAQLFALPSVGSNEALGIVQLEAMACGKPIVNTALPTGVPWVARDGHEALTVEPGDARALAAAVNTLLSDPNRATALGQRGLERARNVFSDHAFLESTLRAYQVAQARRREALCVS